MAAIDQDGTSYSPRTCSPKNLQPQELAAPRTWLQELGLKDGTDDADAIMVKQ
jgi:hypothetical protein